LAPTGTTVAEPTIDVVGHREPRRVTGGTLRLGRIGGVEIDVNWTVLVIASLVMWSLATYTLPELAPGQSAGVYWGVGALGALGLLASILGHELSHAVVARRSGVPVEEITLWMFGGLARLGNQAHDPRTELRIAVAGPLASVAIGIGSLAAAVLGAVLHAPDVLVSGLGWLGIVNIVLAVFNLLPGAPLDGGRVLTAILWRRWGDERRARRAGAHAGRIVGQVLIALGVVELALGDGVGGLWLAVIGWFLTSAARVEETQVDLIAAFEGVRVADVMTAEVRTVSAERTVADFVLHDALETHISSFPVVTAAGRLLGLVTLRRLRQLPRSSWEATTLGAAAVPVDQLVLANPNEMLLDVLPRASAADGRVLVVDGSRLVGIVTPTDVTRALEHLSLIRSAERR
jgi:Zn-dependent protease/predicted transcriptional regulator